MKYQKIKIVTVLALILFATLPLSIQAQIGQLAKGDMVKIYAPSINRGSIVGWVEEVSSFGLLIASGDKQITIPYNTIHTIKESRGKRNRWKLGLALGSISGAVVSSFFTEESKCNSRRNDDFCLDFTPLENIQKVSIGLLVGALVGTGVGLAIKRERWQRISVGMALKQSNIQSESFTLHPSVSFRIPLGRRR